MTQAIDIENLQKLRTHNASMVRYYSDGDPSTKLAQNAALVAAGLPPVHSDSKLQWDRDQAALHQRYVDTLDAVLAHLGADQAEAA